MPQSSSVLPRASGEAPGYFDVAPPQHSRIVRAWAISHALTCVYVRRKAPRTPGPPGINGVTRLYAGETRWIARSDRNIIAPWQVAEPRLFDAPQGSRLYLPGKWCDSHGALSGMSGRDSQVARERMISAHIEARGILTPAVLEAMRQVPRENFLPPSLRDSAYEDRALPVGHGQTISQPYIVALMTELLQVEPDHRVLEIGTGTGYQTAILAHLAQEVFTIERIASLSQEASWRLTNLHLDEKIRFRVSDGTLGWPEQAPFDRILVTAAAPVVAAPLVSQLAEGGRLVAPIGVEGNQYLTTFSRTQGTIQEDRSIAVRFVRLIGEAGFPE